MYDFLNNVELVKKSYVDSAFIYGWGALSHEDTDALLPSIVVKKEERMLLETRDFIPILPVTDIVTEWSEDNLTCYITGLNKNKLLVHYVLHLVPEEEVSNPYLFLNQSPTSISEELVFTC